MTVRTRAALDSLPAYAPGRTVQGAVKLASNELSFPTLPAVADAIAASIGPAARQDGSAGHEAGINRYPDNGATALVRALSEHLGEAEDRIITGCGSVALCQQVVHAVATTGDEVLFGWRSFEAYPIVTQIGDATPVRVPVTDGHALDLPALAAAVTDRTRLVYICTPNNPTGTVVHRGELEAFLDAVPDDVLVVVDEAYREFDTDPDSPDGAEVAARRPNVLALRTLSKAYGLAGLRVGYAVGHPDDHRRTAQGGHPVLGERAGPGRGDRRARGQGRTRAPLAAGDRRTRPGHRPAARPRLHRADVAGQLRLAAAGGRGRPTSPPTASRTG